MAASLSGAAAGLAGGWTMTQFSRIWSHFSGSKSAPLGYSAQEWDASSRAGEVFISRLAGRRFAARELKAGAAIVHYAIAAAAGAGYGTAVRSQVPNSCWSGVLMGTAMWLLGNELLLPALGVIKRNDYSLGMRANALGEHVVYGLTASLICRQLRESTLKRP